MQPICTFKQFQIFALTVAGVSLVSILITLFVFNYPSFAKQRVIDALVFKNNSESMARFETTSDLKNLQLAFYVYNITNAEDVKERGAKINLQELGPFVYDEFKTRTFIDNNQTSGLITHYLKKRYTFNQEASFQKKDPKTLNITWINIPLLGISSTINKFPFFRGKAYKKLEEAIKNVGEEPFIVDSVHNFLIGGSYRPIFEYLAKEYPFHSPLINNTFGLLFGKNETYINHALTTSAGFGTNQTYNDLNKYVAFDKKSELNFWKKQPDECNRVGGTDGEFFAPFGDRDKNLEIFPLDLCRKLSLKYRGNVTMMGIHTWNYVLDPKTLQAGNKNPENSCYCLSKDPSGPECSLDGLIDLQKCNGQINIFASGAHYWAGSANLTYGYTGDGLDMNSAKHEPSFLVEPSTGLALKVYVPIQFNVKLNPYMERPEKNNFEMFKFLNSSDPIFLPFAWAIESSEMTEPQSEKLKKELLIFDTWLITMVLGGSIILIVAIIVAAVILCLKLNNSSFRIARETDPLLRVTVVPRSYT